MRMLTGGILGLLLAVGLADTQAQENDLKAGRGHQALSRRAQVAEDPLGPHLGEGPSGSPRPTSPTSCGRSRTNPSGSEEALRLRAGPLSNDEVIKRVSTNFVPVAMNLYELRKDTGPSGNLFRLVQRQIDHYQGFWMISPDGKALGKYSDWQGDPAVPESKRVPMVLDAAIKAFGAVTPRT